MGEVRFRVLGPLAVEVDGREVPVPGGLCQALLAALLLRPNEVVTADELITRVWGDGGNLRALRTLMNRLRVALGEAGCVRTVGAGYVAEPQDLDLLTFRALAAQGRNAEALELWRGPALAGVDSAWVRAEVSALVEERRAVQQKLTVPRQIPAPPAQFVGRDHELAVLDDTSGPLVISAVSGAAGVGKTALAVRWAHTAADRFPAGQLYVNLRGFDPAAEPARPQEVIRRFLAALGVPPGRVPQDEAAQAGLYRELLSTRKLLLLLDNARDAGQVRPLLPGGGGCRVLITSRDRMGDLEGARSLPLGMLGHDEAVALVAERVGAARAAAEPDALVRLVELCGGLPLALSVVAARAAADAQLPLAALAEEIADEQTRLDFLDTGDELTSVRAAFSWSYRRLSEPAARLFRLLGAHPGPDFTAAVAVSLGSTQSVLDELTGAHLLTQTDDRRYHLHDLVRLFARGLTSEEERLDALHRLLDHYLHSTHRVHDRAVGPFRTPLTLAGPLPGVEPEEVDDAAAAWAWFDAELDVLTGLVPAGEQAGLDVLTWQLAWSLTNVFDRKGRWHEWTSVLETALVAANRIGDADTVARIRHVMARAYRRTGRLDEAVAMLDEAIKAYRELGDVASEGDMLQVLAAVHGDRGRLPEALAAAREALALAEQSGDTVAVGPALNQVGWYSGELGDYQAAVEHCERAVELNRRTGSLNGQAAALHSVAHARRHLGDLRGAIAASHRALDLFRATGFLVLEAETLVNLGDTHHAAGEAGRARHTWQYALAIYEHLGDRAAEDVRRRLTEWAAAPSSG
ncbi:Tetratricopeptide repeat-containing protein [Lentzea xinjiangensis]|uniref:Tetratricopeptide repeat-containing protein n=1 Tax=Lentzea xinjiangensis TaxID=402600 RepID=A0A1H9T499_9PSEU|nr:tetratricopeptide repeat protein [Lentzea xinjiangensis]SER92075.1 Tetratricopeptide repeat-containing protein [Lentzea xinjiangensis]